MKPVVTGRPDAKTPRQAPSSEATTSNAKSQSQMITPKPSLNNNTSNPTNALTKRHGQDSPQLKLGTGPLPTRPSTSRVKDGQSNSKVQISSHSTGSIRLGLNRNRVSGVSVGKDGQSSATISRPLFKPTVFTKIGPNQRDELLQLSQFPDPKAKVHNPELQKFMLKQKQLRLQKAKEDQEARAKEIAKKQRELVDLDLTRRDLVRKFKVNPLLPQEMVEYERSKQREQDKLLAYRPPPPPPPPKRPKKLKKSVTISTKSKSKEKVELNTAFIPAPEENVDSARSFPDPGASIRSSMLLQEYRNIIQREEERSDHLVELLMITSAALENAGTTGATCDEGVTTFSNYLESSALPSMSKQRYSIGIRDLAASKIQGAFRRYKIRKIWREIRKQKLQQGQQYSLGQKPQPSEQESANKASYLSQITPSFEGRLGSPLYRLPPYLGTSSSSSNSSVLNSKSFPKLSKFDDIFPSDATIKQLNVARAVSPRTGLTNGLYRRKSLETTTGFSSSFHDQFKQMVDEAGEEIQWNGDSSRSSSPTMPVPKFVEELLIPVSPCSDVLKDKIRILQEKAEEKQKADFFQSSPKAAKSKSVPGTPVAESEYIGPGNEEMHEAYKLRLSLQQSFESRYVYGKTNKFETAEEEHGNKLDNRSIEIPAFDSSLNEKVEQILNHANQQELIVETVTVELDDEKKIGDSKANRIDPPKNEIEEAGIDAQGSDIVGINENVSDSSASQIDAFQFLESKKVAVDNKITLSNEGTFYSELISEIELSKIPMPEDKSFVKVEIEKPAYDLEEEKELLAFENAEQELSCEENMKLLDENKGENDLEPLIEEEKVQVADDENLISSKADADAEPYKGEQQNETLSSSLSREAERIVNEALGLAESSGESRCNSSENEIDNSSSGEDDSRSIMKDMGMDFNLQEYLDGLESEEEQFASMIENDEFLKGEATRILQQQKRIEAEISELQALETMSMMDEYQIIDPQSGAHRNHQTPSSLTPSEMYLSPPSSAFEEFKAPTVVFSIEKLKKFVETKTECAWKSWKNDEKYSEQLVGFENLEIGLPLAEASGDHNKALVEKSKESLKELFNDVIDEVIRESLQMEPRVPEQRVTLLDKVRPGRYTFDLQKELLPKSSDQLNSLVFNKVTKLIPNNILISEDTGEPVQIKKPIYKWTGKQKDRVDEVLADELGEMENEWRNVWPEETLLKDELCHKLMKRTMETIVGDLQKLGYDRNELKTTIFGMPVESGPVETSKL